jgi:VIT1/CCC1 family predicted Fe2+/Mn2+ transporter
VSDTTEAHAEDAVPTPPYEEHIGATRQYIRDVILGVNDGLVSTFLLVAAVVGGGLTSTEVLLTAVAGALAGMVSMAAGEYLATKSQDEVFQAEMALEADHMKYHRDHEREELHEMFAAMGLTGQDLDTVVDIIDSNDEAMMQVMAALEFAVVDTERRSPWLAALTSGALFLLGALPSVIPFTVTDDPGTGLLAAGILVGIGLFTVGAVKTLLTRKSALLSGLENLAIGFAGGAVAFVVGRGFDLLIGG